MINVSVHNNIIIIIKHLVVNVSIIKTLYLLINCGDNVISAQNSVCVIQEDAIFVQILLGELLKLKKIIIIMIIKIHFK
jgi:hypothetical protein